MNCIGPIIGRLIFGYVYIYIYNYIDIDIYNMIHVYDF